MSIKNIKLPEQDSATIRGGKTALQSGIGTIVLTAIITLLTNVWNVPGVPEVVFAWVRENVLMVAVAIGIPSGIVAFAWNLLRKDVKNY